MSEPGPRWSVPLALAVAVFVHYLDRSTLSIALPRIAESFGWSDRDLAGRADVLLAAFFVSFGLANVFLPPWAVRFGLRRAVLGVVIAFSVVTMASGPLGGSLAALILMRFLLGLGEGAHMPLNSAITARAFGPEYRARANAVWSAGILVSVAFAPLIIVPVVDRFGWRTAFVLLGLAGLLVALPVLWRFVPDDRRGPDAAVAGAGGTAPPPPSRSLSAFLRDPTFRLYAAAGILNAFCAFGILNWLPTYFVRAKGVDFADLGWPLFVVFGAGVSGVLALAWAGDRLNRRAALASAGFAAAAVCTSLALVSASLGALVGLLACAVFCQSAFTAQEYATVQRLVAPGEVATATGVYNGISILFGGVGGSLIPALMVARTGSFDAGLASVVAGALVASLLMARVARRTRY